MGQTFILMGKVAGVGGLALGVFLMIFRDIIKKKIFPMLPPKHAYALIRQMMYLTFGIGLSGLLAWTYIVRLEHTTPAEVPMPKPSLTVGTIEQTGETNAAGIVGNVDIKKTTKK